MSAEAKQTIFDIIKFALITLLIVIPVRAFVAQPFIVSGESMVPTYENGEYLVIDEFSYHFRTPDRGEVVVFRYPEDPSKFFIKRVIGLPGETVTITQNAVTITDLNGANINLDETYLTNSFSYKSQKTTLKDNEYFVMGDNRPSSLDSRTWGALPENFVKGRVLARLLPLSKIGLFPGYKEN
ncbi:MAG: signal peptidase I [Candidatus Paceibacterota bacterium]